jgi:threonine aldolase
MIFRGFASDNNAGVSFEVLQKMAEVNKGHTVGYGEDPFTHLSLEMLKKNFGNESIPFLVFTGTAANVLAISAANRSYNSVICADTAHIHIDECGAPERFAGCKLVPIKTPDGKLTKELIDPYLVGFDFVHHAQPGIISITEPTELGTLYTLKEIKQLSDLAHQHNMVLHLDGARLANAVVALNCSFQDITLKSGVDVLSFGGTKNGLMFAESVIFFNEVLSTNFKYIRKQGMQLTSKMRFIAAQFIAYFENDLWRKNALHSNAMAQKLYKAVNDIPNVEITQKVQANAVFAIIPKDVIQELRKEFFFYEWNEYIGEVRWMTSFDTTEDDIDRFVIRLKDLISKSRTL